MDPRPRARRSGVLSRHLIQRWDLDKTYLDTDTESWRGLLRIPFEKARDKRAIPGVAVLVQQLRRSATARGSTTSVKFVTASPPQIGRAIREKLRLDGIEFDEIRFKDQIHHLVRGRFDALREHVGFKLSELLASARAGRRDGVELLFGDDWESDTLIYSLYADVVGGRLAWEELEPLLVEAGVTGQRYLDAIRAAACRPGPRRRVAAILVLRSRMRPAAEFEPFGRRVHWFDNYAECALVLHALGFLDAAAVVAVAMASGLDARAMAAAFTAVSTRWDHLGPAHLEAARRALDAAGLLAPVAAGPWWRRIATRWRVARGLPPVAMGEDDDAMPDYGELVRVWNHHARRERDAGADD